MVENKDSTAAHFTPSEAERSLIQTHLGLDAIVDKGYKATVLLKKEQAEKRKELISDIEYDYQLALNKGDHYLGKAVINFYLNKEPAKDELFLNFQAIAVAGLTINDTEVKDCFGEQKIKLEMPHVALGWNTVQLNYFNAYNKNRVGLHSYMD